MPTSDQRRCRGFGVQATARLARCLLLCSAGGWASAAVARVHLGPRPLPSPTEEDEAAAAQAAAEARPYGLALRAGYFGGAVLGYGLDAYRRFGAWEIGIAGYYGTADLTDALSDQVADDSELQSYTVDKLSMTSVAALVQARYFAYDSFAVTGGLGYRRISGELSLRDASSDGRLGATAAIVSYVGSVAAGNFWTWPSGLVAGIDWVGLTLPLTSTSRVSTTASGSAAASAENDLKTKASTLAKTLGQAPGLILLLGSVGYRF